MKLNWDFLGGRGCKNKKRSVGGVWIFFGTAQSVLLDYNWELFVVDLWKSI